MKTDFDAIVIGAGPAGATAAILLARAGWCVAVVEKQSFPRRKVCGECIAASNLPLLEALGVGAAFDALSGPELRRVAMMHGRHCVVADLPAAANLSFRWGRALGRETLDTLLLEQARSAGAEVLQPWSVQAIAGDVGDWQCRARATGSGESAVLRAPIVIAAHGSWEAMPSSRPQQRQARSPADLFAFKANFRNTSLSPGLLPVLSFDGGYGGMVVADGGLTTLACCVRRDRLEAGRRKWPGRRAGGVVEALLRCEIDGVRAALQSASREGPWLAAGPIAPGIRLRADDAVFRIGNAAGEAHPIIGEGMSMALQSAWLLCAELVGAGSSGKVVQRELAASYASRWHAHFAPRLRLAAAFARVAMRPSLAEPLIAVTRVWPGLLTAGARWCGKVRGVAGESELAASAEDSAPAATADENHALPLRAS